MDKIDKTETTDTFAKENPYDMTISAPMSFSLICYEDSNGIESGDDEHTLSSVGP